MLRLRRWLVVGITALALGATYEVLVSAFQILALPRFEIPYVEPDAGLCGFGHYDPNQWLVLALLALGVSWAPLGWARGRRALLARSLTLLALLAAALGLTWLVVVGGAVRAILGALRAWHLGSSFSHPGFDYLSYEVLLAGAQLGLGLEALALALLSLSARLRPHWRFRAEALTAARAGLLLVLGAALSTRSAWLNEAGCFPLWPALRRDAPESWDGLWTTSIGFYAGCLLLLFVAWPAARRRAWFVAPMPLGILYGLKHGSWGPQCSCQAVDVPSLPVSTAQLSRYPVARDWSFEPSQAAQLSEQGVIWQQDQFDGVPSFLEALSRNQQRRRELAVVLGPPAPPGNLPLRLAPSASLTQLRKLVAGARTKGYTGVTLELGFEQWHADVGWGIQIPTVRLLRLPVPFADGCSCQLDLGSDQAVADWLRRVEEPLTHTACCLGAAAEVRAPL